MTECKCGTQVEDNDGHEIGGEVMCHECYCDIMDEVLFG